jgi:hypothetical protein
LPPWFGTTSPQFPSGLGTGIAAAPTRQLHFYHIMQNRGFDLDSKYAVVEFGLAHFLGRSIEYITNCHLVPLLKSRYYSLV